MWRITLCHAILRFRPCLATCLGATGGPHNCKPGIVEYLMTFYYYNNLLISLILPRTNRRGHIYAHEWPTTEEGDRPLSKGTGLCHQRHRQCSSSTGGVCVGYRVVCAPSVFLPAARGCQRDSAYGSTTVVVAAYNGTLPGSKIKPKRRKV